MNSEAKFLVKFGIDQMDFDKVRDLLKNVFWSIDIKKDEIIKGALNSALVVGVYNPGEQIAYARVISDKTRFAYIMDVVVHEDYRKQGIGQLIIRSILTHPDLKDVYQWLLRTKDAHGVYAKVGFKLIADPGDWMEIMHKRPHR